MLRHVTQLVILTALLAALSGCGLVRLRAHGELTTEPVYHRVTDGENLFRIADRYGVTVERIAWLNGIRDPRRISAGRKILIGYKKNVWESGSSDSPQHQHAEDEGAVLATVSQHSTSANTNYQSGKLFWPVARGRIVSRFGPRSRSFHDGIDISAKSGTAVFAAHPGEVIYADNGLRGYGNLIILRHQSGMLSVYAHNRRLLTRVGRRIKRGQKIAEVGSTGRSTGPHLHFEIRMKDSKKRYVAVDPLAFFRKSSAPPAYRVNEGFTPILAKLGFGR